MCFGQFCHRERRAHRDVIREFSVFSVCSVVIQIIQLHFSRERRAHRDLIGDFSVFSVCSVVIQTIQLHVSALSASPR